MESLLIKCLKEDPDFISKLISIVEQHPHTAIFALKILDKMAHMDDKTVSHKDLVNFVQSRIGGRTRK